MPTGRPAACGLLTKASALLVGALQPLQTLAQQRVAGLDHVLLGAC